jgi:tetratricopeptide (TPR) repeat protein
VAAPKRRCAHFVGHLAGLDFSSSPHLRGILNDPKQIRDRAFRHATEFFAAAAREHTAVLFLDDLHWADEGSLDLVDHLARACLNVPLLILCLARPTLLERRPFWGEGQEALALKERLDEGSRNHEAASLRLLGAASLVQGQFGDAERYMEEALALFRTLGDRQAAEGMLNNLGEVARMRGDYAAAIPRYQESLVMSRELENKSEQMVCLNNLSGALNGLGEYAAAEAHLRQVISMAGAVGYFALPETYCFLAEACLGQGRAEEALQAAHTSLSLGEETGSQDYIGWAWRALGMVAAYLNEAVLVGGHEHDAEACFAGSLRVFNEIGMEAERARTLVEWSRHERTRGDEARARQMHDEAREIFSRLRMELEVERMTGNG